MYYCRRSLNRTYSLSTRTCTTIPPALYEESPISLISLLLKRCVNLTDSSGSPTRPRNSIFRRCSKLLPFDKRFIYTQQLILFLNYVCPSYVSYVSQVISKVVKNSSMAEMKVSASIGLNHLRQGGYGNWRGEFSVAMSEFFDDVSMFLCEYCSSDFC